MDIFVFPSYREGFGVCLIEALSMGVPVICSDIAGCNEVIRDNETGILVPRFSTVRLAEAMEGLMCNRQQRRYFANKGRSEVIRKFRRTEVCESVLAAYRALDRP